MARILVCEDSPSQALNLRMILEKAGHEVVLAQDGQMGLGILQTSAFDLVMSDVQMPNLGGFDLCRKIRQEAQLVTLPVILMTTLREMQDMRRGQDVGANMYVVKPFEAADLLRRIGRFLPSAEGAEAPAAAAAAAPSARAVTPSLTGIAAIRAFLTRIVEGSQKGLDSDAQGAIREIFEEIHKTAEEALVMCGAPAATTRKSATQGTLLLVQPNESLKRVLQTNLEQQGWHVLGVASSEEGLSECERLGERAIDLLLVEASAMKANLIVSVRRRSEAVKVVCMANADDIVDFDDVSTTLRRPFTLNTLVSTLDQMHQASPQGDAAPPATVAAPAPTAEARPAAPIFRSDPPPEEVKEAYPGAEPPIPKAVADALEAAVAAAAHPPPPPPVPRRPLPTASPSASATPAASSEYAPGSYPPQAYGQYAYPPQGGYPPQDPNYPQGYPPQGYPQGYGYPPQGAYPTDAQGYPQQGYPPYGYPPQYGQEYEGQAYADPQYGNYAWQQQGYPPQYDPQTGEPYPPGYSPQQYEGYPPGYEGQEYAQYPEGEGYPAEGYAEGEGVEGAAAETGEGAVAVASPHEAPAAEEGVTASPARVDESGEGADDKETEKKEA